MRMSCSRFVPKNPVKLCNSLGDIFHCRLCQLLLRFKLSWKSCVSRISENIMNRLPRDSSARKATGGEKFS